MLKNLCKDNRLKKLARTSKTRERLKIICKTLNKVIKSLCEWQRDFCFGASAVNEVEVMRLSEDELKLVRLYRQMTLTDQKLGVILFDRLSLNNEEPLYPSNIYQHHNNVAIRVMKSRGDLLENR